MPILSEIKARAISKTVKIQGRGGGKVTRFNKSEKPEKSFRDFRGKLKRQGNEWISAAFFKWNYRGTK